MSSEEVKIVESTLQGLMTPDNDQRRQAEQKLQELMNNKQGLVYYLSLIINSSTAQEIITYAAVVLRKLLEIKEDEIVNPTWKSMEASAREEVKKNTLHGLMKHQEKALRMKAADVVIVVCENTFENEEPVWQDLMLFIEQGLTTELNENNLSIIEANLYIISKVFAFIYEELVKHIDVFVKTFSYYLQSNDLTVRTKTVCAIIEILCVVKKKEAKKFKDFMMSILETILKCLDQCPKEENNLKLCLTSLADLANTEPNMLRKAFSDLFILMGKIGENKNLEDNVRELSFEIIVTVTEKKHEVLSKDQEKLKILIESLYKYGLEMDNEITEDWTTPTSESYLEEEFICDDKLDAALSLIDRIIISIGKHKMLPYVSDIVMGLLNHQDDWRYKYIGYMTISQIVQYVDDITHIDNILPKVFDDSRNSNPKIRHSCYNCISTISDELNPTFQNNYHSKAIPMCLEGISNENVLRVKLQSCEALQAFIESTSNQVAFDYSQSILDVCFGVFLKPDSEVNIALRESVLNIIAELVTACGDKFAPYAEKCLNILLNYFSEVLKSNSHRRLFGTLLDTITIIGPECKETYIKVMPDLISAMIHIQDNIPSSKDQIISYLQNAWERIIPEIKEHHKDSIPSVINSIIMLVGNVPKISVASQPEKKFDINEFLSGLNKTAGKDNVSIEKKKVSIQTSETEDFAGSLEILNIMIETFSDAFFPYIETTQKHIFPLLTFDSNDDVRAEASNALPEILEVIKKCAQNKTDVVHQAAKTYVSYLFEALDKESDNSVIATFLDNIGAVVEKTGMFLTTHEINNLFQKLMENFDKVERNRLTLLNQKDKAAEEIIQEQKEGNDKIYSDDENSEDEILDDIERDIKEVEEVLVSLADVMGSLFNTHKDLCLEFVDKLLKELLPKYLSNTASVFEKKMALFIIDDMIEFLGQNLLSNIWQDLFKIPLQYIDSKTTELRQAACYGIGEFAKHTTKDFNFYAEQALSGLSRALGMNSDGEDEEEWGYARDNAVASIGKIIIYQNHHIDVNSWVQKWIEYLPLNFDHKEAEDQHGLFCKAIKEQSSLVLGSNNQNLPKIIRILAKVYNSKLSNEEVNKQILEIFENIKQSENLQPFVIQSKEGCENKILKKILEHFP